MLAVFWNHTGRHQDSWISIWCCTLDTGESIGQLLQGSDHHCRDFSVYSEAALATERSSAWRHFPLLLKHPPSYTHPFGPHWVLTKFLEKTLVYCFLGSLCLNTFIPEDRKDAQRQLRQPRKSVFSFRSHMLVPKCTNVCVNKTCLLHLFMKNQTLHECGKIKQWFGFTDMFKSFPHSAYSIQTWLRFMDECKSDFTPISSWFLCLVCQLE